MTEAIRAVDLVKRYGPVTALAGISFSVARGEVFGLLGPNGAGKTTTIKILTGLTPPTSGQAYVAGFDVVKQTREVKRRVGWVSSEVILDDDLTAWENLELQARLQGVRNWRERARELLNYFGLLEHANRPVGGFSTGMRKRLEIATALLHSPEVLFLDEPTIGLDVNARAMLWDLIKTVNREFGVTILLTTHYMEEAEALCRRIAIIDLGKIIAVGTPDELKASVGGEIVELDVDKPLDLARLKAIPEVVDVAVADGKVRITVRRADEAIPAIVKALDFSAVRALRVERPSLDAVFMKLTGRRIEEAHVDYRKLYIMVQRARR
ncbi:daunorubicin resistance protein DrrA family ABC transporter ATP-binding protein [Thermoproteus tenax]|uniref:ABC-type multidrug transport system, ATPase component n=1 Tax=Thermoproteus tenax (strain ATCC 35583 / DSM 2078 / JCM 9277 / NBRC 100435 / Kra 1) TaxID=768679 RepID=G4RJG1_THETK|nr:daunorubicin resistance protein DrrA family ABC transporter ATP-binding protein [Thermoproteus tenax]CCC81706.1 ABC-type multidrug transport system, ATPase component [Thermoproteus tenax Kra 1]